MKLRAVRRAVTPIEPEPTDEGLVCSSINLPRELHKALKIYTVTHDTTVRAVVTQLIRDHLRVHTGLDE